MRIKSISATSMLVTACLAVASTPSRAGPICWIDRVVRAEGGINVYFIQKVLNIGVKKNSGETSVSYTASNGVVRDREGHERDHLFVSDGVEFHALQMAHDSCSYKVSSNGQFGNVTAKAAMHLPGLPPAFAMQIIGTDGSVSDVSTR
jgi:hypothetical protein